MQYSKGKRLSKSSSNKITKKLKIEHALSLASVCLVLYFGYTLLLSDHNIFRYIQKVSQIKELQSEISSLEKENEKLQKDISYLEKDPFFIEKKAREDLGLKKEGEEVYVIPYEEKKEKKDTLFTTAERWITKMIHRYTSKD